MEKISWDQVAISIPYRAGQITEKRMQKITDELNAKDVKVSASIRNSTDVVVFMLDDKGAFVITPESLSYNLPNTEDRFGVSERDLMAIIDIMSLEDKNLYTINAQGTMPCEDSHNETREKFNQKHADILNEHEEVYGVGYRFLIRAEEYNGELKIEPLLSDCHRYYFQYIINTSEETTVNYLCDLAKSCLENDISSLMESL